MVSEYRLLNLCQEIFRQKSGHGHRHLHEFCGENNCRMAWKKKNKDVKCSDSRMIRNPAAGWMRLRYVIVLPTNDAHGEWGRVYTTLHQEPGIRSGNQYASGVGWNFCGDGRSGLLNLPDRRRCPRRHNSRVGVWGYRAFLWSAVFFVWPWKSVHMFRGEGAIGNDEWRILNDDWRNISDIVQQSRHYAFSYASIHRFRVHRSGLPLYCAWMKLLLKLEVANKTCLLCYTIAPENLIPVKMPCPNPLKYLQSVRCSLRSNPWTSEP